MHATTYASTRPVIGFYGDDFTGSLGNIAPFHAHGLRATLFLRVPDDELLARYAKDAHVVGIAGVARSMSPEAMVDEVRPSLALLHRLGARVVQYKVCSTFDSGPRVGSIGRMIEVGREIFGPQPVPIAPADPDMGRWTVFGQHFARAGQEVFRLDRHPTMANHPSTPMGEADLRLHLAKQTALPISTIDLLELRQGPSHLQEKCRQAQDQSVAATVVDSFEHRDLDIISEAIFRSSKAEPVFCVGSQGLASAFARTLAANERNHAPPRAPAGEGGVVPAVRMLVVSGSASPLSADQLEHAQRAGWPSFRIDTELLLREPAKLAARMAAQIAEAFEAARGVLVYTAMGPHDEAISRTRAQLKALGRDEGTMVAQTGRWIAALVSRLLDTVTLSRLVLAGGDSSSLTLRALGADVIEPVAESASAKGRICRLRARNARLDGLEVLLKGGQGGAVDLYQRVLEGKGDWQ